MHQRRPAAQANRLFCYSSHQFGAAYTVIRLTGLSASLAECLWRATAAPSRRRSVMHHDVSNIAVYLVALRTHFYQLVEISWTQFHVNGSYWAPFSAKDRKWTADGSGGLKLCKWKTCPSFEFQAAHNTFRKALSAEVQMETLQRLPLKPPKYRCVYFESATVRRKLIETEWIFWATRLRFKAVSNCFKAIPKFGFQSLHSSLKAVPSNFKCSLKKY